jgi:hypothetical protein
MGAERKMAGKGIITEFQKIFLEAVGLSPLKDIFYLSGETALAEYYLGHRYSEDLDFFSSLENHLPDHAEILKAIGNSISADTEIQRSFGHFSKAVFKKGNDAVITDWVCDTPFRLGEKILDPDFGIYYDDLIDIGANKISALFDRADIKDFVDIYFLEEDGYTFDILYANAQKKHIGLDNLWMTYALTQINSKEKLPRMIKNVTIEELREHFMKIAEGFEVF